MSASTSSNQRDWGLPYASPAQPTPELPIEGITPFTTIDFPGRLAAVLYTKGCEWRCSYCHNSHLWQFGQGSPLAFPKLLDFLQSRIGLLDGVVFCGGEPTAHQGLMQAMQKVRDMGFQIALHTTGIYPEHLKEALRLCDWVGMDVKAPFDAYQKITQVDQSGAKPALSVEIVLQSGVEYEFRTTVHPDLLSEADILTIAEQLLGKGVKHYALQAFQPNGCANERLKSVPMPTGLISEPLKNKLAGMFESFQIRK